MIKKFRVLKPADGGYIVVGNRTFPADAGSEFTVEVSVEIRDLLDLLEDGTIDFVRENRAVRS